MISYALDEKNGILTVRPEGKLENLRGLIIVTEKFPGWKDFSGMVEHIKFVRGHHREIGKIALVTDSKIADLAESLGTHFIKASIKHFSFDEEESARSWIAQA
jgi:hypothetical protein